MTKPAIPSGPRLASFCCGAVLLGLLGTTARAQPATPTTGDPAGDVQAALQRLLADPALQNVRVGVLVHDLESGEELASHDADHGYMTASNMKLVASSTALCTLGPDFRFTTSLLGTGPVHYVAYSQAGGVALHAHRLAPGLP